MTRIKYSDEFFLNDLWTETDQSETSIMKLAYAKNNIIADKSRRIFFENFTWVFPRSTHQDASIELLFVKFGSVGASEEKDHSKKTRLSDFL